jgi:acyl carrier protein
MQHPSVSRDNVLEPVVGRLDSVAPPEARPLRPGTRIESLEMDSPDIVEVLIELEDHFGVVIPDESAAALETIGDIVDAVTSGVATAMNQNGP